MFEMKNTNFKTKEELYLFLNKELEQMIRFEPDSLANLSNASALLWQYLDDINWSGFYIMRTGELVLGPFQGKPACVHISIGSGVCGTAAKKMKTQLIEDVHQFPGHIACDGASNSEIVIPIIKNEKVVAVIDIDSPSFSRFDNEDQKGLEKFAEIINKFVKWEKI